MGNGVVSPPFRAYIIILLMTHNTPCWRLIGSLVSVRADRATVFTCECD